MDAVRSGSQPELTTRQKHLRECWVVPEEGADLAKIENDIKTMKNYFDGNASLDEALDMFKKAVVEKYPELTAE